MRKITTSFVALIAVFALAALFAAAATAHTWESKEKALTTSMKVVEKTATFNFEQQNDGLHFQCTLEEKGTVGPGAAGEITSITSTAGAKQISCTTESSFCEAGSEKIPNTIEATNLPWKTELVTFEGALVNQIAKSPEWKIKCDFDGLVETDYCLAAPNMHVKNVPGELAEGVEETISGGRSSCVEGNLETGGGGVLLLESGANLYAR